MQLSIKHSFFLLFAVILLLFSSPVEGVRYGASRCKASCSCYNGVLYCTCQPCACEAMDTGACQHESKAECLNCTFPCNNIGSCHNFPDPNTCFDCLPVNQAPPPTPTPTPTPYPTVAILGNLREYLGASCQNNISSNGLSIRIAPQNSAGVTSTCGITPPAGQTRSSYRCTITFNNQQNPKPTPAQSLSLNVSAPEYQTAYWTSNNSCSVDANNTINVNVAVPNPTTVFNKDIFFRTTTPWIKLKNSSFAAINNLVNIIPYNIAPYDSDDTNERYFIINDSNDPGLVTAPSLNIGTAQISSRGWLITGYQLQQSLTLSAFIDYIRSRKQYQTISSLNNLTENKINFYQGDLTINNSNQSSFNNKKVVLIVLGTVSLEASSSPPTFEPNNAATAILAYTIKFGDNLQSAKGVFIAQNIITGSNSNQGLKITGNLVTQSLDNQRRWNDNSKPSVFIIFDPKIYLDLLPYLSISKYDWRQSQ